MTVQKEIIQRISALPQNALTELLAHLERIEEAEKKKKTTLQSNLRRIVEEDSEVLKKLAERKNTLA